MSSCGLDSGSSGGGSAPLPNGYRYYRLFTTGDPLPNGAEALFLPGAVRINDLGEIIFHAGDRQGLTREGLAMGVYELLADFSGERPRLQQFRQVVRQGDLFANGKEVLTVGLAGLNHHGTIACKLQMNNQRTESIYLERQHGLLEPVVEYLTPLPGNSGGRFSASLGNFDIYHNDDLMVSSHYFSEDAEEAGEGLFHLPGGQVDGSGRLLLSSGDMVPDSAHVIDRVGLFEGEGLTGSYVVQVHTSPAYQDAQADSSSSTSRTAVITGNVRDTGPGSQKLLGLPRTAGEKSAIVDGNTYYAPRVGDNGSTARVIHLSNDDMALLYNDRVLAATGGRTPRGRTISSFGGPVVGPDGLVYCVAFTDDGAAEELLVSNGAQVRSVLCSGDRLGASGARLLTIAFGLTRDQVDGEGRLVFIGEFDDHTLSVMAGVPV